MENSNSTRDRGAEATDDVCAVRPLGRTQVATMANLCEGSGDLFRSSHPEPGRVLGTPPALLPFTSSSSDSSDSSVSPPDLYSRRASSSSSLSRAPTLSCPVRNLGGRLRSEGKMPSDTMRSGRSSWCAVPRASKGP